MKAERRWGGDEEEGSKIASFRVAAWPRKNVGAEPAEDGGGRGEKSEE